MQEAREDKARLGLAMASMSRELEEVNAERETLYKLYMRWTHHHAAKDNVVFPRLLEVYRRKIAALQLQLDRMTGMRIPRPESPPVATGPWYHPDPWYSWEPAWYQQQQQQQHEEQVRLPACLEMMGRRAGGRAGRAGGKVGRLCGVI